MVSFLIFIISLITLLKSADWFVDSADSIARHLKLPSVIIGATIVAFGTSAPELFVSGFAANSNQPDVIFGNIFGSNIANTCLIFGLAIAICVCRSSKFLISQLRDNLYATLIYAGVFIFIPASRPLATCLLILFFAYQLYLLNSVTKQGEDAPPSTSLSASIGLFVLSLILLIFSSKFLVNSIVSIAIIFGVSKMFLSIFLVAFGTSLPELITTIRFVKKGHLGIVIGNVFGSNLFNLCFVLPIGWLVRPVSFMPDFYTEISLLLGLKLALFLYLKFKGELPKSIGYIFIFIYFFYLIIRYQISLL